MKEFSFDNSSSAVTNPNYLQAEGFINPLSVNKYLFCTHLYEGTGGVQDGSYLIPFERELFYQKRKMLGSYRNFLKPIVNAIVEPVFSNPITRDSNNEVFDAFIEDVDNRGTTMNDMAYEIAVQSRLHGVTFIVMDNFQSNEIPSTQLEVISQRKFPYIYTQPAYSVEEYEVDKFSKLISITFIGKPEEIDGKQYKVSYKYDSNAITKIYKNEQGKVIKTEQTVHGLNVIPVIPVYSVGNRDVLPEPPFYDIAKLSCSLFNKDSELRDQDRAQAFSVFYAQLGGSNNNIAIGPHSMLNLPIDPALTITPGYASPDSSILQHLMDSTEKFIDSIFRAANQHGVIGIRETSGIAESYRFQALNNQLKRTAAIMQSAELKIADLFSKYIQTPIEYEVSYTAEYDAFYAVMSIDDMTKLLQLDLADPVKLEIKKMIVAKTLNHLNQERIAELQESLESTKTPVA